MEKVLINLKKIFFNIKIYFKNQTKEHYFMKMDLGTYFFFFNCKILLKLNKKKRYEGEFKNDKKVAGKG